MTDEKITKTVNIMLCTLLAAIFIWAALKYALPVILPFAVAYAVCALMRPLVLWLYKKTKIPEKIWASVVIIAASALVTFALWKIATLVVTEAGDAVNAVGKMISDKDSALNEIIRKGADIIEKITPRKYDVSENLSGMINGFLGKVSETITGIAGTFIVAAPSVLFSIVVTFIALFYFALDKGEILKGIQKFLPENIIGRATHIAQNTLRAMKRFAKAYLTIMAITFGELLVGFLIIGIKYPFLAALVIAVVDILPVLGVGTVLLPWSAILFFTGEGAKAIAMLVLCGMMYIIRQFAEPKIVGNCAGVHPLLALVSVYAGFKLAGVGGMIVGPVILNAISIFWEEKS